MTGEVLPSGAIIDCSQSFIVTDYQLASGGLADVKIGMVCAATSGGYLATDDDFFLPAQDFDAVPLNSSGDVKMGTALIGQLKDTAYLTFTIITAALTAGKVSVYVAYIDADLG